MPVPIAAIVRIGLAAEFRQLAYQAAAGRVGECGWRARLQSGRAAIVMPAISRPVGVEASCGLASLLGGVSRRKHFLQSGRERFAPQHWKQKVCCSMRKVHIVSSLLVAFGLSIVSIGCDPAKPATKGVKKPAGPGSTTGGGTEVPAAAAGGTVEKPEAKPEETKPEEKPAEDKAAEKSEAEKTEAKPEEKKAEEPKAEDK